MIIIPPEEQKIILDKLFNIPAEELKELCDTKDRLEQFYYAQEWALLIRENLQAYFSGIKIKVFGDKQFQRIVSLKVQYYLQLYNIIWHSWENIEKEGLKKSREFFNNPSLPFPSKPGEMLVLIVEMECWGLLAVFFPEWTTGNYYARFSPRKVYENINRYETLLEKYKTGDISNPKYKEFAGLNNELVQKYFSNYKFDYYRALCVEVAYKNNSNDFIKRGLVELEELQLEIDRETKRCLHPKHKMKGYSISKGVLNNLK